MKNKKYKKLQRKINKAIRLLNEIVANDKLWRGRFYARQMWIIFGTYENTDIATAAAEILFIDKETGVVKPVVLRADDIISPLSYRLWSEMSTFIVNETRWFK